MGNSSLQRVMRHIRRLADHQADQSPERQRREESSSDHSLLTRFIDHQDETALATLVGRHGPMVRGVCQRLLDQEADRDF